MSSDSDIDPDEYQSMIMNLIPEFVNGDTSVPEPKPTDMLLKAKEALAEVCQNQESNSNQLNKTDQEESKYTTPVKTPKSKPQEDTCKVDKWRKDGFEAMIEDIKQEISDGQPKNDVAFNLYDVPEDDQEICNLQSQLAIDKIDDFIESQV